MKYYINNIRMNKVISDAFIWVFNLYGTEEEKAALQDYYIDEEYITNELVPSKVAQINKEMGEYLHQSDHSIVGNFGNISRDYDGDFKKSLALLDAGEDSDEANKFRDYCTQWFLDSIGLFGLAYDFEDLLGEVIDRYEIENA